MKKYKHILFVVNVDWFFLSHRLPIALEAKQKGYDVTIAAADTGLAREIKNHGLNFIDLPELEKNRFFLFELRMVNKLKRVYENVKPDLVHHVTIRPVLYGSLAAKLTKIPAMANALSGLGYVYSHQSIKNKLLRNVMNPVLRRGFRHPNSILILQNDDDRKLFLEKRLINPKKIRLIKGSGVDLNLFSPSDEPKGRVNVALIGRMLWDKGVGEFAAAVRILYNEGVDASFHLYGAPYPSNPMSIPEKNIQEWVQSGAIHYHGNVDTIAEELKNIHIVCLPSYREGLPKALLEAAAAGKPIVTTDVPGCREVVDDGVNGFLVPPKNVERLAMSIKTLIDNPGLREEFGRKGRKKAEKEFSEERIVGQTLDLYAELLH